MYTKDGSAFACEESQEDILRNAVYNMPDTINLKLLSGGTLDIRVPEIQSWSLSTPEIREMQTKINLALDDEFRTHRLF